MATALEVPNLIIGVVSNHRCSAWIAIEEVLANKCSAFSFKCLVIAIESGVHQIHKRTFAILCKKWIPTAAPYNLDDIPACATEDRFELLNNLAVTAHRTIEALQITVNDKR